MPDEKKYQPHEQRVVDEHKELADRREKLAHFMIASPVFSGLPQEEQARLRTQHFHMSKYKEVLEDRISCF